VWPHSFVIGVNGVAVTIGTDDHAVVDHLQQWCIDEPSQLVDFGLELHPVQPSERSAPRNLPNLKVGSDVLARTDDVELLRDALLRVVAAATNDVPAGMLRVSGAVLERDGRGYLVPEGNLRTVSMRVLQRRGVRVWPAQSILVDAARLEVVLDPPLGSNAAPRRLPLDVLWLNHREPNAPTTPGEDVARLLGHCSPHPASTEGSVTASASQSMVALAATLVASVRPRYVAFGRQALENELTALIGR
jgi:hypothetical protein